MQNSTLLKILLSVVVVVGGVVFFVKTTFGSTQDYYKVDELMANDLGSVEGREIKVHGWVLAGSIKEEIVNQQTLRTFVLQKSGKTIRIFNRGPKPDTFKDQSEVVATGKLVPAGTEKDMASQLKVPLGMDAYVFEATDLQAKCPSKYDGANVNKDLKNTKFE